jgi:hypothetical protein
MEARPQVAPVDHGDEPVEGWPIELLLSCGAIGVMVGTAATSYAGVAEAAVAVVGLVLGASWFLLEAAGLRARAAVLGLGAGSVAAGVIAGTGYSDNTDRFLALAVALILVMAAIIVNRRGRPAAAPDPYGYTGGRPAAVAPPMPVPYAQPMGAMGYGQPVPPPGYAMGWYAPQRSNGLAVASLITGILGISVIAVILGHVAIYQINRSGGQETGKGMAIAGCILGWLWILALVVLVVLPLAALGSGA